MRLDDEGTRLMAQILARKETLERQGGHPRVVILGKAAFALLEKDWLEALEESPDGDDLVSRLSMRRRLEKRAGPDGTMFGMAVFGVDILEGFEVF